MMTLHTSGDAARALRLSRERVRQLEALGVLRALAVTVGGIHLFETAEVERLRVQREQRRTPRVR
jgi:DNA-binding transcriptional MerR regulator